MTRIGILTCQNAVGELGCASAACLADLRKRRGAFAAYPTEEALTLVGILSCPGCPTLSGTQKFEARIRGLLAFRVDAIHLANCVKSFCPFRARYIDAIRALAPAVAIVEGTHEEHITPEAFRAEVGKLFAQPRRTMTDLILGK